MSPSPRSSTRFERWQQTCSRLTYYRHAWDDEDAYVAYVLELLDDDGATQRSEVLEHISTALARDDDLTKLIAAPYFSDTQTRTFLRRLSELLSSDGDVG